MLLSPEELEILHTRFVEYIDYAASHGMVPQTLACLTICSLFEVANYSHDDMRMFCEKAILAQVALEETYKATLQE